MPDRNVNPRDELEKGEKEIGRINNEADRDHKHGREQPEKQVGRVHNEQIPVTGEKEVPVEKREVGRINNEKDRKRGEHEVPPEEREVGVINNEKRDSD